MMTTRIITPNTFALTASEGRTLHPLNILGTDVLVKLANADTDGAVAIFDHAVAPMFGPRLHRHSREDEWLSFTRWIWLTRFAAGQTRPFSETCRHSLPKRSAVLVSGRIWV
jgi:hypothetical protein